MSKLQDDIELFLESEVKSTQGDWDNSSYGGSNSARFLYSEHASIGEFFGNEPVANAQFVVLSKNLVPSIIRRLQAQLKVAEDAFEAISKDESCVESESTGSKFFFETEGAIIAKRALIQIKEIGDEDEKA